MSSISDSGWPDVRESGLLRNFLGIHTSLHGLRDSQEISELLKPATDISFPVFAYNGFGQSLVSPN